MPYEHLVGAGEMLDTLMTFSDNEETFAEFPSPGLHHHMPVKGETKPTIEKKV